MRYSECGYEYEENGWCPRCGADGPYQVFLPLRGLADLLTGLLVLVVAVAVFQLALRASAAIGSPMASSLNPTAPASLISVPEWAG